MTVQLAYTLAEAAQAVRRSEATLRRAIHATDPNAYPPPLRAKKDARGYLIGADDLREWFEALPDA